MSTIATKSTTPVGNSTLDQANYLQLLVTQMTSQDPLNPQSDTAFAAQLAQFSSLQLSQSMSNNMQALQASSLIGQNVTVTDPKNSLSTITGPVNAASFTNGVPSLLINGNLYAMNTIVGISAPAAATTPATGSTTPSNANN